MKRTILLWAVMGGLAAPAAAQSITVASPNGGESWALASPQTISWRATGISGRVSIILYRGGVPQGRVAYGLPITPGTFRWEHAGTLEDGTTVPAGNNYRVAVRSIATGRQDLGDSPFTLTLAATPLTPSVSAMAASRGTTVRVVRPNGRQWIYLGSESRVEWTSTNARPDQRLKATLVRYPTACKTAAGAEETSLGSVTVPAGYFIWYVNSTLRPCENCAVRLSPLIPGDFPADESDDCFTLLARTSARIVAPNGGESFRRGGPVDISWEITNPQPGQTVQISLGSYDASCSRGDTRTRLGNFPTETRSLHWLGAPTAAAGKYVIHVGVVSGVPGSYVLDAEDQSDTCFTIS
jgi:hypothetical protein